MEAVDCLHHRRLGLVVKRRGRLIKHQYLRVVIKCPRNAKTLPLSAGNAHAAVADGSVKPLWQPSDKIRKLRLLERLPYAAVVNLLIGDAKRDVISDWLVHQIDGLRNIANLGKPCRIVVKDILTVTGDAALLNC